MIEGLTDISEAINTLAIAEKEDVLISAIEKYARDKGWKNMPYKPYYIALTLYHEEIENNIIILNRICDYEVFCHSVVTTLMTLSKLENRSPQDIAQDIRAGYGFVISKNAIPETGTTPSDTRAALGE